MDEQVIELEAALWVLQNNEKKHEIELKRRKNVRKLLLQILENIEKEEPTVCLKSNAYAS